MPVSDRDQGFNALFKRLSDGKNLALTVGVHGPEGAAEHAEPPPPKKTKEEKDIDRIRKKHGWVKPPEKESAAKDRAPLTVADIATIHEYGLGHNPERSFIRAWADENKSANEKALIKIGQAVVEGKFTAEQGLDRAGLLFVAQIQKRIKGNIPPPLNAATIKKKKSSTPLINTGQLWTSIRHKVGEDTGDK